MQNLFLVGVIGSAKGLPAFTTGKDCLDDTTANTCTGSTAFVAGTGTNGLCNHAMRGQLKTGSKTAIHWTNDYWGVWEDEAKLLAGKGVNCDTTISPAKPPTDASGATAKCTKAVNAGSATLKTMWAGL